MADEELDPSSSKFDPKKAIYASSLDTDNVDGYSTVEQCITAMDNKKKGIEPKKKEKVVVVEEPLQRNFLPEQMPVQRTRKQFRHVLIRMESFEAGPLATLRYAIEFSMEFGRG